MVCLIRVGDAYFSCLVVVASWQKVGSYNLYSCCVSCSAFEKSLRARLIKVRHLLMKFITKFVELWLPTPENILIDFQTNPNTDLDCLRRFGSLFSQDTPIREVRLMHVVVLVNISLLCQVEGYLTWLKKHFPGNNYIHQENSGWSFNHGK